MDAVKMYLIFGIGLSYCLFLAAGQVHELEEEVDLLDLAGLYPVYDNLADEDIDSDYYFTTEIDVESTAAETTQNEFTTSATETTEGIVTTSGDDRRTTGDSTIGGPATTTSQPGATTGAAPSPNTNAATIIALGVCLGVFVILFVVFLVLFVVLKRRTGSGQVLEKGRDSVDNIYQMSSLGSSIVNSRNLYRNLKAFVPRLAEKDVQITDEQIGEGRFGPIYSGILKVEKVPTRVVYKTLKDNTKEMDRNLFMAQLDLNSSFELHTNVLRLYGACISSDHIFAAYGYAERGNLRSFLRQYGDMPESQQTALPNSTIITRDLLVGLALGVGSGMRHLASRGIVHRELAAKHVLLADDLVPKIAGLNSAKAVKHLTVRWNAPEVISDNMYTLMSDVWSFGIVLWELMTLGEKPYPNLATRDIFLALQGGFRMPPPENTPDSIYSLMRRCWDDDPHERPSFLVITKTLKDIAVETKVSTQPNHTYEEVRDPREGSQNEVTALEEEEIKAAPRMLSVETVTENTET